MQRVINLPSDNFKQHLQTLNFTGTAHFLEITLGWLVNLKGSDNNFSKPNYTYVCYMLYNFELRNSNSSVMFLSQKSHMVRF